MEREWDSWLMKEDEEKCMLMNEYKNREGYSGNLKNGI